MNCEDLKRAIQYAPLTLKTPPPDDLRGWWHSDASGDWYVCANCAGRIMARGLSLSPCTPVWSDTAEPFGVCATCEGE